MQTRILLLFILFLALAVFFATMSRQNVSDIASKQQAQVETMNQLDEIAFSKSENSD